MKTQAKPTPVVSIDPEAAIAELKWLGLAVSKDATRVSICRVRVDEKRAVATDGHRLHFIEGSALPAGFSIRAYEIDLVLTLAKTYSLQSVEMNEQGTHWQFSSADGQCKLDFTPSEFEFPDYERVLPKQGEATELKASDLRKAVECPTTKKWVVDIGEGRFQSSYVKDALNGAPKTVTAYLPKDSESPLLFRYGSRGAVVMPRRK